MDPLALINGLKFEITETPECVQVIKKVEKKPKPKSVKVEKKPKSRFNALIDESILERARNIVVAYEDESISDLAERGLLWAVEQFEAKIGGPAPQRTTELKVGRKKKKVVISSDEEITTEESVEESVAEQSSAPLTVVETEVVVSPIPEVPELEVKATEPPISSEEIEVNV